MAEGPKIVALWNSAWRNSGATVRALPHYFPGIRPPREYTRRTPWKAPMPVWFMMLTMERIE